MQSGSYSGSENNVNLILKLHPSLWGANFETLCWLLISGSIWERILRYKSPVIEPRDSALFPQAIEDYKAKLEDPNTVGAVFFAVCRGKVGGCLLYKGGEPLVCEPILVGSKVWGMTRIR